MVMLTARILLHRKFQDVTVQDVSSTYSPSVIVCNGVETRIRYPDNIHPECIVYIDNDGKAHRDDGPAIVHKVGGRWTRHYCTHGEVTKSEYLYAETIKNEK